MSITSGAAGAGRWPRLALVVLAVGQLVSSVLSDLYGGTFTTSDRPGEPAIVPPGWTFSIWGVIILLSIGWAVWVDRAPPRSESDSTGADPTSRLVAPLLVVFAGFSVWLAAAELEPVWSTLVVFVVMLAALLVACRAALTGHRVIRTWSPVGRWLLWTLLGLYTGWSSVAIWLNLTTALVSSGAPVTGALGVAGQAGVLVAAVATGVSLVRLGRAVAPMALAGAAAITWAFAGATVGAWGAGEPLLAAVAVAGTGVAVVAGVLVLIAALRRRGDRGPASPSSPDHHTVPVSLEEGRA